MDKNLGIVLGLGLGWLLANGAPARADDRKASNQGQAETNQTDARRQGALGVSLRESDGRLRSERGCA